MKQMKQIRPAVQRVLPKFLHLIIHTNSKRKILLKNRALNKVFREIVMFDANGAWVLGHD